MKNRKVWAGVLAAVMITAGFAGCAKKETPKEVLEKSVERSMEIASSRQTFEMDLTYDLGLTEEELAQDPMAAGMIDMLNNMAVSGEFSSDVEKGLSQGSVLLDLNGMQFNLEIHTSNLGEVYIKLPMSGKYLTINTSGEAPDPEDIEEMKAFSQELTASMIDSLSEGSLSMEEKTVALEDGEKTLKEITVTLGNDEAKALIKRMIPEIYAQKTLRKSMENNVRLELEMEGKDPDAVDMDAEIDRKVAEAVAAFDEAEGTFDIDTFVMVFGIDEAYNTRVTDMSMLYSVSDETMEKPVAMGIDFKSELYAIDEPVSIEFPEVNEDNSTTLEEFMMQMMFGGMAPVPMQP